MKYKDWLTQWLENYVYPSVKVRTFERYKLIVERHIKEKLGGTELSELSLLALQSFITELLQGGNKKTGGGLAANSVNSVISVIQSSLKTAHLLGLTKEYTADKLKRPKLTEKPVECFSLVEQKRIEQAIMSGKKWRRRNRGQKIIRTSNRLLGSYYSDLVPVAGLEPARYRSQRIVSPSRLSISPHRHTYLNILAQKFAFGNS